MGRIPEGKYPCTGGKTWAISPQGKAHLTRYGGVTNCGKAINYPGRPGRWELKARDHFHAGEDFLDPGSECRSCL